MNKIENKTKSSIYNQIIRRPFFACACILITIIIINGYNSIFTISVIVVAFLLLIVEIIYKKKYEHILILLIVFIFISIFTAYLIQFSSNLLNANEDFVNKKVNIYGTVYSIPNQSEKTLSFILKPDTIIYENVEFKSALNDKILVYLNTQDEIPFDFGDKIKIDGSLLKSSKTRYKGGFDYRINLFQKNVSSVVYANIRDVFIYSNSDYPYNNENKIIIRLMSYGKETRDKIVYIIKAIFPEKEAGLLAGMLIGIRKDLDKELQNAFTKSGLLHIMAVSGANILFIIMPLIFILKKLKLNRLLYLALTVLAIFSFVFITGFEPSVMRAAIMATVFLIGKMIYRNYDLYTGLSIACIIMIIINPYTIYNIGFILSFTAVLSLGIFYKKIDEVFTIKGKNKLIKKVKRYFKESFSAVMSVQLGVMPIGAILFNSFSIISFLNNILVGFATIGITIMGMAILIIGNISLDIAKIFSYPCLILLKYIIYIVTTTSKWDYASLRILTPSILAISIYYFFIIWIFKTKKSLKIILFGFSLFFISIILINYSGEYLSNNDEIHIINIGKGDSIFFKIQNRTNILIDGGESDGDKYLIPFLLDNRIRRIDILIGTHGHSDHINGFMDLIDYYNIGLLVLPEYKTSSQDFEKLIEKAQSYNISIIYINENDSFNFNNSTFKVLNPQIEYMDKEIPLNNTSIVLKYTYKDFSMLLTGDLEENFENILLNEGNDIEAEILKIGHHGSNTSTSELFLNEVNPQIAVISVNKNNYNHPAPDVLTRLYENEVIVYRTDINSEIIIRTNGKKFTVETLY